MSYLTFEEYKKLRFNKIQDKNKFDELEPYAEQHIDRLTSDYYLINKLELDTNSYRVLKFKTAMAIQTEYLYSIGGKTSLQELLSSSPSSVSVGRMRIESGSTNAATVGRTMVATEAYNELIYTGLLYKGVDYR
ncbi:hypothetical protein ABQE19_06975 [Enterococcus thailandicus]|uniref:hypothetical protein n=1 Tax=Enterococcus thailandicus TaxID=417368 RepID=UPI0032E38673